MSNKKFPLMRKATAVWLVENTILTFKQIAEFCGLHELEVQSIANGNSNITGHSPVTSAQLSSEEIKRCEKDINASLKINQDMFDLIKSIGNKKRAGKYTPIARRGDKPNGIAYLLKYYPDLPNAQIKKLIGTTDKMIDSIKDKTYWNMKDVKPRDVVLLGLCNQSQFNEVVAKFSKENKSKDGGD